MRNCEGVFLVMVVVMRVWVCWWEGRRGRREKSEGVPPFFRLPPASPSRGAHAIALLLGLPLSRSPPPHPQSQIHRYVATTDPASSPPDPSLAACNSITHAREREERSRHTKQTAKEEELNRAPLPHAALRARAPAWTRADRRHRPVPRPLHGSTRARSTSLVASLTRSLRPPLLPPHNQLPRPSALPRRPKRHRRFTAASPTESAEAGLSTPSSRPSNHGRGRGAGDRLRQWVGHGQGVFVRCGASFFEEAARALPPPPLYSLPDSDVRGQATITSSMPV